MSTRKLASASFANLLIPVSGILVSPFLSRELGPDGRGLYAALSLPIVVCGWFGTYGLQDALTFHLRHGRLSRRAAAKVSLLAAVPLGALGVILLALLGLFTFTDNTTHYREYLSLALLAPLHILANLLIGALTGASDVRGVNFVKVVPALTRTAVVVVACVMFDVSAYAASLLFLASVLGGLVIGLARLRSAPKAAEPDVPVTAPVPTGSLIRYSLLCLPGVLTAISTARLDQVIGLPVIGARQLGYYAVAVSVAEIPMVIATAARTVLMGRPATGEPRAATRAARIAVLASALACAVLATTAGFAVPWVFGRGFAPAVPPTVILCAATTLYTCMVIFGAALLANGRAGWSSTALVTGCAVSIALLFLLAPLGATGAAIASLGGYGVSAIMAAGAISGGAGVASLRMLAIPYREDLSSLGAELRNGRVPGAAPLMRRMNWLTGSVSRAGVETCGAAVLFVLAWLRVLAPQTIQLFAAGRPAFNSRDAATPVAADLVGNAISLAFILLAAVLVTLSIRNRRADNLWWLAAAVAPLLTIELSSLVNHEPPSLISLALPVATVAIWLQPPRPQALAAIGVVGAATAAGAIALALVRPDIALLSGRAAGDKTEFLGGLLAGPYPHSNVLGIVLALTAPFIFCLGRRSTRLCSLVVVLVALFWTGSRSSQLATAVMLLTYGVYLLIKHEKPRRYLLSVSTAAGIAMIILVPILTKDPDRFTERGRIWMVLLNRWAARPTLGLGPAYFEREPGLASALRGQFNHAHNILVQLLTVGGLLAVGLFALLLYLAWRQSTRLVERGIVAPALFLIAFVHVSWLEASHVSTTLTGYLTWLPLVLIARLGLAARHDPPQTTLNAGPTSAVGSESAAYAPAQRPKSATMLMPKLSTTRRQNTAASRM